MEEPYIPTDPHQTSQMSQAQMKIKQVIKFTLQCLISIYIALEISQPPNPYKTHLIVLLSLYICLKHDIPNKILTSIEKLIKSIKSILA